MKLTKEQINALANKFQNELKQKKQVLIDIEKNKLEVKLKKIFTKGKEIVNKYSDILHSIQVNIDKFGHATIESDFTFENFLDEWAVKRYIDKNTKFEVPDLEDIKNDVILATIDKTSVDEIIKTLQDKYK